MTRMMRMMRRALVGLGMVVVVVGAWVVWLMHAAGEFRALTPHFDGSCVTVNGVVGAEDLTIHPRTGVAYVSAADRRALFAGEPPNGALYAYDLEAASPQPINLTPDADASFSPHGLSLYVGPDGTSTLFVINHADGRNTIEVYDVAASGLTHRATLADPSLVAPNDLLAVSPTELYVTNDHRHPVGVLRKVEDYGRRPWANVVRWDGTSFHEVAGGIRLANGINRSPDGKTIYVASTIGQALLVYERDAATGALALRGEIPLASGADNVEVDADGSLWIGSHPKLLTLVRYMSGAIPYAPSQVLHVTPRDGGADVKEVYLDLGEQISAASVAAARGSRLLIGAIADGKILDCRMRTDAR